MHLDSKQFIELRNAPNSQSFGEQVFNSKIVLASFKVPLIITRPRNYQPNYDENLL